MSTTNRVFKTNKVIQLDFTGVTSDQLLTDSSGNSLFDISDVDWQRIVMEHNVTSLTGTAVTFKVLTTNNKNGASTSAVAATQADGSTAFKSASVSGAGVGAVATGKTKGDGSAASNIGKYLMVLADVDTISALVGTIWLYIEGR